MLRVLESELWELALGCGDCPQADKPLIKETPPSAVRLWVKNFRRESNKVSCVIKNTQLELIQRRLHNECQFFFIFF